MTLSAVQLIAVDDEETRAAARRLIAEYLRWIADAAEEKYGLAFDVEAMVTSDLDDRSKFYPPGGRFYVVRHVGQYVGVGCLKALSPRVAEIQRMYVQPEVRGVGAAAGLTAAGLNASASPSSALIRIAGEPAALAITPVSPLTARITLTAVGALDVRSDGSLVERTWPAPVARIQALPRSRTVQC